MVNTCLTGNITPSPYVRQYALENSIVYCVYAMHSRSSSLQHNISNWKWVESFLGCCSIFVSITFLLTHRCQYSFWFSHFVKYIPFWIFLSFFGILIKKNVYVLMSYFRTLYNNLLVCECSLLPFVEWLNQTKGNVIGATCNDTNIQVTDFPYSKCYGMFYAFVLLFLCPIYGLYFFLCVRPLVRPSVR